MSTVEEAIAYIIEAVNAADRTGSLVIYISGSGEVTLHGPNGSRVSLDEGNDELTWAVLSKGGQAKSDTLGATGLTEPNVNTLVREIVSFLGL